MALVRRKSERLFGSFLVVLLITAAGQLAAQERVVPETYTAVTTNMSPAGVELKADVLRWSTESERRAAIAALESEAGPSAALRELPTLGVVWRAGSAVGHSIKYAHRTESADGHQVITLVTDRAIGSTSFEPWVADAAEAADELEYSVVSMTVGANNNGQGTMSLAASVTIDSENGLVSLDSGAGMPVLTNVRLAPKPYWAN